MTILCVGVVCLDIIHICDSYPLEDSKTRSLDMRWTRGGNASNSCTVLSLMGAKCEFLGTIGVKNASFLVDDFKAHGISLEHAIIFEDHAPVTATLVINTSKGTRTCMSYRGDLPELSFDDFNKINLSQYSWIHIQGRNSSETSKMLAYVAEWNLSHKHDQVKVSLELEFPRYSGLLEVSLLADFVFVSKDFACYHGWDDPHKALAAMSKYMKPGGAVIVPWAERGAVALGPDGMVVESPAFPPARVLDTIGAGDTFIAATIFGLDSGLPLVDSIKLGCRIAGVKVGDYGLSHIKQAYSEMCKQGLQLL